MWVVVGVGCDEWFVWVWLSVVVCLWLMVVICSVMLDWGGMWWVLWWCGDSNV